MNKAPKFRWISALVPADIHKRLMIIALDKSTSIGVLARIAIENYVEKNDEPRIEKKGGEES